MTKNFSVRRGGIDAAILLRQTPPLEADDEKVIVYISRNWIDESVYSAVEAGLSKKLTVSGVAKGAALRVGGKKCSKNRCYRLFC